MDAVEYLKAVARMCNAGGNCDSGCPMADKHYYYKGGCSEFVRAYPAETIAIIEKWATEHPVVTNLDKFKEVFGVEPKRPKVNGAIIFQKGMHESWWDKPYDN